MELFHFSENPNIERFVPHVPATNPDHPPAVWAIDAEHAPLYWFPRDCPRVAAWPRSESEQGAFASAFGTVAPRLHAIELGWVRALASTTVYRYRFDPAAFRPWPDATGQWIADDTVEPTEVVELDDLVGLHDDARIELRAVTNLWPLRDLAVDDRWDFSIVRFQRAQPRS